MLSAIAIIPSAPVMVPELAATAADELTGLRDGVFAAASSLPPRWVAIGVGAADDVIAPERCGTFAGYGVDLPVALSAAADEPPGELPLCALVAGWVRAQVDPQARAQVRVYARDRSPDAALESGRRLRREIDAGGEPTGVLVVADGLHTLTPPAPGGYEPDSVPVQAALDDALAGGDTDALARLSDAVVGRVAYQVAAGLAGSPPRSATEFYRGAPYGVGYFAGVWHP
ncbi:hypothetical protein DVS77_27765 [Mycolicibacterium moriokaense]|nr:hypothetical protein DVS77_27765 [Mycolicibacterium moriokaense]